MDSYGVYLSRIFHEVFPKPVYSTMVVEKFQIYSVKITANTFLSQNSFYSCSQAKLSPPGFYHYLPGRWELSIPPKQRFLKIFFTKEKG